MGVVERLIERQKLDNGGAWPETIALVLWGTDNIKTYGESLAQVLWMVGVRPKPDALGMVNKLELIPLEELGRPRIDVVVNCSGVFRDLFVNQMNLLDRAINLAVENSSWNDEAQLQDMYLSRKSFAFDSDAPGAGMAESKDIFASALKTVDVTF